MTYWNLGVECSQGTSGRGGGIAMNEYDIRMALLEHVTQTSEESSVNGKWNATFTVAIVSAIVRAAYTPPTPPTRQSWSPPVRPIWRSPISRNCTCKCMRACR